MVFQSRINGLLIGLLFALSACMPIPVQQTPVVHTGSVASQAISLAPTITIPKTVSGALVIGSDNAPVTMLLFTNHDCAYCKELNAYLPRLQTDFIDTGTLRVVIVTVPLNKYPDSDRHAQTLICGVRAGSGSDVHRMLFEGRANFPALKGCIDDQEYLQATVARQHEVIQSLEITLVPTYFLKGMKFVGLPSYADLRGQIEEARKE